MIAPSAKKPLSPGTVLGDTYRIERQIAVGGMGELYEATHLRLSGRYAIKVLLPQYASYQEVLQRFAREAEITSRLRHPNIVSVLDFNTTPDGRAFLAMEFLEGWDLAEELARAGPMDLPRVLDLVAQVVSSLAAAHSQGVVHRDLKPQNLFITRLAGDGREMVKVLDFGISKVREARTKLTREHTIIGTPQYMAPEQAQGYGHAIDHRADQFALASITYEMLAGQEAFQAETIPAILYLVVHEAPAPLIGLRPDLPAALERVLLRGLAKEATARFPDISAFGEALQEAAVGRPPAPARAAPGPRQRQRPVHDAPTLRDERRNTTFGASTAEVSENMLYTLQRPQRRMHLGVGVLVGGTALVGLLVASRRASQPAAVVPETAPERSSEAREPRPTPTRVTATPWPRPVETPPPATQAAPVPEAPATNTALLSVVNPPSGLRVTVDGERVVLPAELARRPGYHVLHFESPGRQSQTLEVDAMAARHEIRVDMPRRPRPHPAPEPAEPAEVAPPSELPSPAEPSELRPAEPSELPSTPEPAPPQAPPEKRVPLIDDI